MPDAAYYRSWRSTHPEYKEREKARCAERRRNRLRGDRSAEYAKRQAKLVKVDTEPLPLLYPNLQRGVCISFWQDELRLDLAQEHILAELEDRDPDKAVAAYHARETNWYEHTVYQIADEALQAQDQEI